MNSALLLCNLLYAYHITLRPHGLQSPGPDFFEPCGLPNSTRRLISQFSNPSGPLLLGLVPLGSTVGTSPRCCTPILISFDCCSDGNRYSSSSSRHRYSHSRTTHHHSHSSYCTHEKPHGLKETPPFGIQRYYFSCGNTVDIIFSTGLRPFSFASDHTNGNENALRFVASLPFSIMPFRLSPCTLPRFPL